MATVFTGYNEEMAGVMDQTDTDVLRRRGTAERAAERVDSIYGDLLDR